jgi:hypothetical protein
MLMTSSENVKRSKTLLRYYEEMCIKKFFVIHIPTITAGFQLVNNSVEVLSVLTRVEREKLRKLVLTISEKLKLFCFIFRSGYANGTYNDALLQPHLI